MAPLCSNSHWFLYVIDNRKKTVSVYDSYNSFEHHRKNLEIFKKALSGCCQIDCKIKDFMIIEKELSSKQTNLRDCGVFMLCALYFLSMDEPCNYSQKDMNWYRTFFIFSILLENFPGECAIQERNMLFLISKSQVDV